MQVVTYYGYTISPNQMETGEGFLICRNVPIARTGDQVYLGSELGLTGADALKTITVHRPEEEVFSDAAMASFEGKPVTNGHPPQLIGPDDVEMYGKGHVEVVRKGAGEWDGYLIGDIHVHSRELIEAVKSGKREISCGYSCEYEKNGDGTYTQRNIRGNHVAVVDQGRAGKRAAILDSKIKRTAKNARTGGTMKHNALLRLFGLASKDKTPEEIEQMAMDAAEMMSEVSDAPKEEPEGEKKEEQKPSAEQKPQIDEDILDGLAEKVAEKIAAKKKEEECIDGDPMKKAIDKLSGEGDKETKVVSADGPDKNCGMDAALAMEILKAMQPTVAAIENEKQRKGVADALIQCVTDSEGDIATLVRASQKAAEARATGAAGMDMDTIQATYDAMNPHKRKENK